MHRSWLMMAVAPVLVVVTGHAEVGSLLPVAVALLAVFAAQRSVRLRARLEQLRVLTLVGFATPGVLLLGGAQSALFWALWVVSALATAGVASEFSEDTAWSWLLAPRSLRALLVERVLPGLIVGGLLVATLVLAAPSSVTMRDLVPLGAVLLGGLPLFAALTVKEPFKAMLLTVLVATLGFQSASGGYAVLAASLVLLLAVLARPRAALTWSWPVLHRASSGLAGRQPAVAALVRKELKLQRYSFALVPVTVALWALSSRENVSATMFFSGLLVGIAAGLTAIAEERQASTLWCDAAALPTRLVWRVKWAVTFAVALVAGVLVPAGLLALRPGLSVAPQDLAVYTASPWLLLELLGFAAVVGVATALAMACASLSKDVVRAFVGVLAWGLSSVLVLVVAMAVLGTVLTDQASLPVVFSDARVTRLLSFAAQLLPALVMVGVYASVARRAWLVGTLPGASLARAAGVIAVGSLVSGALREAVTRMSAH